MDNLIKNQQVKEKTVKAQIYNFKHWVASSNAVLLHDELTKTLETAGYTILQEAEHYFPNGGYTCVWLLAESHLALHTFPEDNRSYVELSGCNEACNTKFKEIYFAWLKQF